MRFSVPLALCALVGAALVLPAGADAECRNPVAIGAWNINWLGRPDMRSGDAKGVAQRPTDLAAFITSADVQILGLMEIVPDVGRETNATLDATVASLNRDGAAWTYRLFPSRRRGYEDQQLTGIAWNEAQLTAVGEPVPTVHQDTEPAFGWDRGVTAMKFARRGGSDFVLMIVHMKANIPSRPIPGSAPPPPPAQRAIEAATLVGALPLVRRAFEDRDLVILGDTNVLSRGEEALRVFRLDGYVDLNDADQPTTIEFIPPGQSSPRWPPAPFDRVFVPEYQPEFLGARMTIHGPRKGDEAAFRRTHSDHALVRFTLCADVDDD